MVVYTHNLNTIEACQEECGFEGNMDYIDYVSELHTK